MGILDMNFGAVCLNNFYGVIQCWDGFAEEADDCAVVGCVDVLCDFNASFCALVNGCQVDGGVIRHVRISIKGFKNAFEHGKIGKAICFGFDGEANKYALVISGNAVEEICQFGALEHRMIPVSRFVVVKG